MSDDPHASGGRGNPPVGGSPQQGPYQQAPPHQQPWPPQGYGPQPYGPPPAPPRDTRPWYRKEITWILGGVAVLFLVAVVAISGAEEEEPGSDEPQAATESPAGPPETAAEAPAQEIFAIGDMAHTGDFDVTVHAVQDPYESTNQFDTPPDGQRFVAVEATITNTSDNPLPFSTFGGGAELFDQLDRPWSVAFGGIDLPRLDAPTVAPGEARRGWVVFAVPPDATSLRIRIKGNFTATGSVFQLT